MIPVEQEVSKLLQCHLNTYAGAATGKHLVQTRTPAVLTACGTAAVVTTCVYAQGVVVDPPCPLQWQQERC